MPKTDERGPVSLRLGASQYEAMMCALEAVSTGCELAPEVVGRVRSTWVRLLLEGGHATAKEVEKISRELKVAGP